MVLRLCWLELGSRVVWQEWGWGQATSMLRQVDREGVGA